MRKTMLPLLVVAAACDPAADDALTYDAETAVEEADVDAGFDEPGIELSADDSPSAASGVWNPRKIDPSRCGDPEEPVSAPPRSGRCDIELRVVNSEFATGQGISEGKGEISIEYTATTAAPPSSNTLNLPDAFGGSMVYTVGEKKYHGAMLGEYTVPAGATLPVEVCADFTEHDNGGANGGDDHASMCSLITLECDPFNGQPSIVQEMGPRRLCGDNVCRGSVATTIKVMRADADMDGVENEDDLTPEPCDELEKGKNGNALLQYFHYDDDDFTTLAQAAGTDLSRPYPAYDYKVLLIDSDTSSPGGLNRDAIREADLVFPPTREGLLDAMQVLTSEGYRFDAFVHAHGYKNGSDDSSFEVLSGSQISGNWLLDATEPDEIGTARGGIPMLAWWSTTCIAARQIDAWLELGAQTASGAVDVQFYPNAYHNFVDGWLAMETYGRAVEDAVTPGVVTGAETVIAAHGATPPWGCIAPTVLGDGPCVDDYFNDDLGCSDAAYDIWEVYDASLTGAENMAASSERDYVGFTGLRFGGALSSWP